MKVLLAALRADIDSGTPVEEGLPLKKGGGHETELF